jgi:succinate dehydrogenase / fumarate reductase iron-sulfur subunit
MNLELQILRSNSADSPSFWQHIPYECENDLLTAAYALREINENHLPDKDGNPVLPIRWECSCMQKKCGACAMLINGVPRLACDVRLTAAAQNGIVRFEPLRKFPVIADLIVDRSDMMENLKTLQAWFTEETVADEAVGAMTYDAARCLQCGCCLEVCPNFYAEGAFFGAAAAIPAAGLLSAMPQKQQKSFFRSYRRHFYDGCGKSLACRNICPAGIDVDRLLVNSNAAAVWKRKNAFRLKREEKL